MAETVSFASNGDTAQGYLARPATGTGPGVLVLQEWWGLVPQIKNLEVNATGSDAKFAFSVDDQALRGFLASVPAMMR